MLKKIGLTGVFFLLWCVSIAQPNDLEIYYEKNSDGYIFFADNPYYCPYQIQINFKVLKNLVPNHDLRTYVAVAPARTSRQEILRLKKKPESSTQFDFNYTYTKGDPTKSPDQDHLYWFPFEHGTKQRVGQGYNGKTTHRGINAIDFNLDIGQPVFASRSGTVVEVKEDSNIGGNDPKYDGDGNRIVIYHSDGTFGQYVHLKQNGSLVSVGEAVEAGQKIGISGNTGWSSGPHLHFMVTYSANFKTRTLPIKYLNYNGSGVIPLEGNVYYAYHPGKPEFEVKLSSTFDESKYENQTEPSQLNNTIEIETEKLDGYAIIYVNNGMNKEISGELGAQLTNMTGTKKIPYTFSVPAKTKKYILTLMPKDPSKQFGYELSAKFRK